MNNTDESSQYKDIIKILGGLQKIKAPANFEANLMRRIHAGQFEKKKSFLGGFFFPSWLVPSAAVVATAVIILFVVNINSGPEENPLLAPPRIRENVSVTTDVPLARNEAPAKKPEEKAKKEISHQPPVMFEQSAPSLAESQPGVSDSEVSNLGITITGGDNQGTLPGNQSTVSFSNGYPINKSGLNYRQRNLTQAERMQLEFMKKKMQEIFREPNK